MKIENSISTLNFSNIEQLKKIQIIQKLKQIENRVIAHELAHKAVAGRYAGVVSYTYTRGPDGRFYVTGGEVSLDTSEESKPEDTIKKMEIIIAAALAPSDPSNQDVKVAQIAAIKKMKAEIELSKNEKNQNSQNLIDIFA
ncbi:MAG: putative metalloprotease CJM1_0395 family protein [Thermodesulfovibrio sp.]|nr:hypothetical protein [Thermodesulfovibrio sp.]MDW7998946.1 putative metalloprotease CJM1_0395 family protein [Thermodesulfovibrio sp.]